MAKKAAGKTKERICETIEQIEVPPSPEVNWPEVERLQDIIYKELDRLGLRMSKVNEWRRFPMPKPRPAGTPPDPNSRVPLRNATRKFTSAACSSPSELRERDKSLRELESFKNKAPITDEDVKRSCWDGKYIIIANSSRMPNVLRAFGMLPEEWEPGSQILNLPTDALARSKKAQTALEDLQKCGSVVLYDERVPDAPLVSEPLATRPGGMLCVYPDPKIKLVGHQVCDKFAHDFLRAWFFSTLSNVWNEGFVVPRTPGSPRIKNVRDYRQFASLLSFDRMDFSSVTGKGKGFGWQVDICCNVVEISEGGVSDKMQSSYELVEVLNSCANMWRHVFDTYRLKMAIDLEDLHDPMVRERIMKNGKMLGLDEVMDAYEKGVPAKAIALNGWSRYDAVRNK